LKVTRIYTTKDGGSAFEDIVIGLFDKGDIGCLSERIKVKDIIFRTTDESYDFNWHNAPERQFVIIQEGEVDITTSDGVTRRFKTGDVLLAEDITGKGHISRAVDSKPRKSIFVTLA